MDDVGIYGFVNETLIIITLLMLDELGARQALTYAGCWVR
jgi:hypothetical protein